ncbi:carbohydrate ABC transporter permease [Cellulomonas sp. ACRRI]|uniref:carbohydrate ABC transporter permease n=1 Tax=Cellulomonas sp. ACRRI TaxID=2918188 RepID=UPI001EF35B13|nr:carbohydrate ABC transporter permease [Cellulomonas sp. ACRRI]MCG7286761.1 carbohydrate ABC transporter permease [Cellulomonas sp. ACRRI]
MSAPTAPVGAPPAAPPATAGARRRPYRALEPTRRGKVLRGLLLAAGSVLTIFPFYAMVVIALRPETAIDFPSSLLPWNLDTSAFREVLAGQDMLRWTLNSVVYSAVSVVAVLVMASMAGYAFAKKRFPGREAMFWSFLAMVMVPYHVTLIPTFIVMAKLGGVDTYWGLILPSLANAQAVFLMRQFIKGLPDELFEAAKIDGAGEWRTFATIVLPLCKPVLATLGTFVFLWHWNDFLWPLIIGKSADMWTLTVGIASLRQQQVPLSVVLAGSVVALVPIFAAYAVAQRSFQEGVAQTGIKG